MKFDPATFNPHDPAFLANPYPTYANFRRAAPVAKVAPYGSWWVFRYDDVKTVLEGKDVFLKSPPVNLPAPVQSVFPTLPPGVFAMDPPRHDVVRPILDEQFGEAITGAAAEAVRCAQQLLTKTQGARRIELYADFAEPLAAEILLCILGVPKADQGAVGGWVSGALAGHDITAAPQLRQGALTCGMALSTYFGSLMHLGPLHPELTGMVPAMQRPGCPKGMTDDEARQSAVNLAVAGYLSTAFLICTGTLNLLQKNGGWQTLRDNPGMVPMALEELLRFDAPAQLVDRYAAVDMELGGVVLREGDLVTAVLGSANHDDDAFPNPESLELDRNPKHHFSFGEGIHRCIGAPLARVVAPAAFTALLGAYPNLSLAGIPQWQTDPYLRSVSNLPLATV